MLIKNRRLHFHTTNEAEQKPVAAVVHNNEMKKSVHRKDSLLQVLPTFSYFAGPCMLIRNRRLHVPLMKSITSNNSKSCLSEIFRKCRVGQFENTRKFVLQTNYSVLQTVRKCHATQSVLIFYFILFNLHIQICF